MTLAAAATGVTCGPSATLLTAHPTSSPTHQVNVDGSKHILVWFDAVGAAAHHQLHVKHNVAGKDCCSNARDGNVDDLAVPEDRQDACCYEGKQQGE
jgi:hypothetical protein